MKASLAILAGVLLSAATGWAVLTATVNDSVTGTGNNQFDYDPGWSYCTLATCSSEVGTCYLSDMHYAFTTDVSLRFRFSGNQVIVYTFKEPADGIIGYKV